MLRVTNRVSVLNADRVVAPAIVRDFADPYLEFVRLLHEATNIEHALLVQYLYAAFSVKDAYVGIVGAGLGGDAQSLLGVAIQEMRHLASVNGILLALGASPNLERLDFPIHADIYPFPLELRALSLETLARYIYTEAPATALDADDPANAADLPFIHRVLDQLGGHRVNHLGGLYATIVAILDEYLAAGGPSSLGPSRDVLLSIKRQGEGAHYRFFRSLLEGTHPSLTDPTVWDHPGDARYPSVPLEPGRSAFAGDERAVRGEELRQVAWLSDLHYWIVLSLLDLGYRASDPRFTGAATSHMRALYVLGKVLATRGIGVPFDLPDVPITWGPDSGSTKAALAHLVSEAAVRAKSVASALPSDFPFDTTDSTLAVLKG
jgi:hypothetical protein